MITVQEEQSNLAGAHPWVSQILEDVSTLPRLSDYGNMANMIVFGEDAEPILTAPSQPDIAIAAAESSTDGGRIIAFTNIRYGLHFLNDNNQQVK